MNKFWKAVLLNILGIYGLTTIIALSSGGIESFLLVPLIISAIEVVVGVILMFFPGTKEASKVMLAATGIIFLIGLGVCSVMVLNIH